MLAVNTVAPLALLQAVLPALGPGGRRRRHQLRRRRGGLRGLGRLRREQGRARPPHRRPRRRAPRPAGLRRRSRRHGHRHAPGGLPRRGHQRPAGPGDRRPRAARPGRRRAAQRPLPGGATWSRWRRGPAGDDDVRAPRRRRGHRAARVARPRAGRGPAAGRPARPARSPPCSATCPTCSSPATSSWSTRRRPCRPASSARRADGVVVPLHVSTTLDDGSWVVEVRRPDNSGPDLGVEPGTVLELPGGVRVTLLGGFPTRAPALPALARPHRARGPRRRPTCPRHGQPIRYGYLHGTFPLADVPERLRDRAGQRRDGQRRAAVHRPAAGRGSWPAASRSSR